jgi:concentrative nucleoside transporter, CNT family
MILDLLRGLLGMGALVGIAYLFSTNKKAIDWRLVGVGLVLQVFFGILVMKVPQVNVAFQAVGEGFVNLLSFSGKGAEFVFGGLAKNSFTEKTAGHNMGFIVAFQVLTTVIFFATLSAGLYYLGILQRIVFGIAWVMSKTMGLSGPESLSAAGNIFMGQTEAPLLVKPYIATMTHSEIMCLMTGGMATIAGGVLAAYVGFLGGNDPVQQAIFAAHLLSASVMNAPAAVVFSKIIVPQTQPELVKKDLEMNKEQLGANLLDALSNGAREGLFLALNIGAMLIAFIALIAMLNAMCKSIGGFLGLNSMVVYLSNGVFKEFSLEYIFGQIGQPLALIMGVDYKDSMQMGSLLGQKTAINEFIAYQSLASIKNDIDPKTLIIATYALCGFSNFSSIAIQIGGIGEMAKNQQPILSKYGLYALLAASLACMLTGTVAGALH